MGIYCYIDKKDNTIVYVGKDSNIDKNYRDYQHRVKSNYKTQQINRILQNNPNRYTYQILVWNVDSQERLNALEIQYIRQLNPKFNFTNGGDGINGFRHSDETKTKISESNKGKLCSEETKRRIGQANKGNIPWNKNKVNVYSEEARERMSKSRNTSGFYRVSKIQDKSYYQGFRWRYSAMVDGKRIQIYSINLNTLEKKVKSQRLEWKIIDKDKANESLLLNAKFNKKTIQNKQDKSSTGFYRVSKVKDNHCKQGFLWQYTYPNNDKRKKMRSVDLKKLEKQVKEKNLLWKIVNPDNAFKSLQENKGD